MLGATRLEHRPNATQGTSQQVGRILEAIAHIVQERVLLARFIANVNRQALEACDLIGQFIDTFVILLFQNVGIRIIVAAASTTATAAFEVVSAASSVHLFVVVATVVVVVTAPVAHWI